MQQTTEYGKVSGFIEQVRKETLVGYEGDALLNRFAVQRKAVESRLESGETESATIVEHRHIRRNDPCPCGSKDKFKKCCGKRLAENDERVAE